MTNPDTTLTSEYYGLTKREYFAALALQSILTNKFAGRESMAEAAVFYADQLIEELNKEKK